MADQTFNYSVALNQEQNEIHVKIGNGHLGDINLLFNSVIPNVEPEDENPEWTSSLPSADAIRGKTLKLLTTIKQFEENEAQVFIRLNGEEVLPDVGSPELAIEDNQILNVKHLIKFS